VRARLKVSGARSAKAKLVTVTMARAQSAHNSPEFSWRTFLVGVVLIALMFALDFRFLHALQRMDLIAYDLRINAISPHPTSGVVAIAALTTEASRRSGNGRGRVRVEARLVDAAPATTRSGDWLRRNLQRAR